MLHVEPLYGDWRVLLDRDKESTFLVDRRCQTCRNGNNLRPN